MPGRWIRRYSDLVLAGLVVGIIAMMIIPLPTWLLDILLATNISLAVVLLLTAIYVTEPLRIATFPTILLITTLFRLGLNVSSTRLILSQADAGEVIRSFGHFVVAGNLVVGAIVFLILTLIQFVVIARGSERVAEVAARFALDALPGKQMSIDAELRAGYIDQQTARQRRRVLERESQFYGSMDGAMKYVKGDAIAGIVITLVNLAGGLAVGLYQQSMSADEALSTYGLLTIGDGLVSQIPALVISTAAGLVITRVASEEEESHLGRDIASQLLAYPRALLWAGGLMLLFAAIPGLPALPFGVLGLLSLFTAWGLYRRRQRARSGAAPPVETLGAAFEGREGGGPGGAPSRPLVEPISLELSASLGALLDHGAAAADHRQGLAGVRDLIFDELGVMLPAVTIHRDVEALPAGAYRILLKEVPLGQGRLPEGMALALVAPELLTEAGISADTAELPGLAGAASWVPVAQVAAVSAAGYFVAEGEAILAAHLSAVLRRFAHDFVGIEQTRALLGSLERSHPRLVAELVPRPVPLPLLAEVLARLTREGVNIRHLADILPALAAALETERDPALLTEHCRLALGRQLTHVYTRGRGSLSAIVVDPEIEALLSESVEHSEAGSSLALEPALGREIQAAARDAVAPTMARGEPAVLVTGLAIRHHLQQLLAVELPTVTVLSYQELPPELEIHPVGRLALDQSEGVDLP